jgi:hypothetical protein
MTRGKKKLMILRDFQCQGCGFIEEDLVPGPAEVGSARSDSCPRCGGAMVAVLTGANPTRMHDPEARDKELRARSYEHSRKEINREPERWGVKSMKDPARWNVRNKGK